jgi:hypothetical protein
MERAIGDGANVVPLWVHQAKMDDSPLRDMREYWDELCAGRVVPLRSEVDPRAISTSLENGFILERAQPASVRFRLAGTHLSELMGMEVRGMPLRAFIDPAARAAFTTTLERVFEGPEVHEYRLISSQSNAPKMTARMLILPMKSDQGTIDRALGCMVAEGNVGLTPRRFQIAETRITSLVDGRVHREIETPVGVGFSEPKQSFKPQEARSGRPSGKPNLRLVKSDTWG